MAWLGRLRSATSAAPKPKLPPRPIRGYGSAAAVELDYDYDSDYYEDEQLHLGHHQLSPKVDSAGSAPGRGVQWILIGEPRMKRHVFAERLSKLLEVPHISMGSLVRQELHPRSALYKQIANAVNEGKLVPEDVIFGLLSKRLEEGYYRGENGFILDGIPRSRIQAEILDQILDVDLVVNFKSTEEHSSKKKVEIQPLLQWKGNLQGMSVEEYYKKQQKLLDFQVKGAAGDSWLGLLTALHLQPMHAISSSQKLTA